MASGIVVDGIEMEIGKALDHMDEIQTICNQTNAQVLIFPACTPQRDGCRISYLLSVRQVAEVLHNPDVQPVPFGPRYAEGVAQWRGRVLPVLSLEDCLGIEKTTSSMPLRTIVVRGVTMGDEEQPQENYAIVKVGAAVRHLALPFECDPLPRPAWVTHSACLHGLYKMQDHLLLALNINEMINFEVSKN